MSALDPQVYWPIIAAILAGGAIGFEREYRARSAGFRTHILVCVASALLMICAIFQTEWIGPYAGDEVIRIDPVRMAHGILTGIGFLCGGVIFREGLSMHGLTTAASLWTTSAIGTLLGVGMYQAAAVGAVLTLLVLTIFRLVDAYAPGHSLASIKVRYHRKEAPDEESFSNTLGGLKLQNRRVAHYLVEDGKYLEYATSIRAMGKLDLQDLTEALRRDDRVVEYALEPREG